MREPGPSIFQTVVVKTGIADTGDLACSSCHLARLRERKSNHPRGYRSRCMVFASTTSVITRSPITRICLEPSGADCAGEATFAEPIDRGVEVSTTGPGGCGSSLALPLPFKSILFWRAVSKYRRTAFAQPGFLTECKRTGTPRCLETDSA